MKVERPHRPGDVAAGLPADRAAAIRLAALRLFAAQGYRATTMADIGAAVGIRGPSLYKHVAGKQVLLAEIMLGTMQTLLARHAEAVDGVTDVTERLRRAVEAHVRYHARHRLEAFVGNREIGSLEQPARVLRLRSTYERGFRELIERGVADAVFGVRSARLASYSILDMGMGVANWFHDGGEFSVDQLAYQYGDLALRVVGARVTGGGGS
jgi:AcrR family transcriptional regulator